MAAAGLTPHDNSLYLWGSRQRKCLLMERWVLTEHTHTLAIEGSLWGPERVGTLSRMQAEPDELLLVTKRRDVAARASQLFGGCAWVFGGIVTAFRIFPNQIPNPCPCIRSTER